MSELLGIENVTVRFDGLVALHDVGLAVEAGTVLGVIGPNGAGKTTLFNVVCGFVRPSHGTIRWCGEELREHAPPDLAGLGIARTLQGLGLFAGLTVLENALVGAGGSVAPVHCRHCSACAGRRVTRRRYASAPWPP